MYRWRSVLVVQCSDPIRKRPLRGYPEIAWSNYGQPVYANVGFVPKANDHSRAAQARGMLAPDSTAELVLGSKTTLFRHLRTAWFSVGSFLLLSSTRNS